MHNITLLFFHLSIHLFLLLPPTLAETFTFYNSPSCPYAERTAILLEELALPFETRDIDLRNKPSWFQDVSPKGKVPCLAIFANECQVETLYESLIINEYLAESQSSSLLPSSPLEKAKMRLAIDHLDSNLNPAFFTFFANKDSSKDQSLSESFNQSLDTVEDFLKSRPFLCSQTMTLADIAYIPFFERMSTALSHFKNFEIDPVRFENVCGWMKRVFDRPSFKTCEMGEEKIIKTYAKFREMDYKFGGLNRNN